MIIGERIRNIREDKDILQQELADAVGINVSVLSRIEKGTRQLRDDELIKIADKLNVSVDYLLGRTDEPQGTGFQKGLLGDINGDSPLAQKAREDNKESPRIEKALQEYRDILSNHDGHVACKQMKAFYKKHLNDNEFFEALAKHTPMDGGLTRRERNMLAHYRIVDEDTKQKIEERTKELFTLYMLDEK